MPPSRRVSTLGFTLSSFLMSSDVRFFSSLIKFIVFSFVLFFLNSFILLLRRHVAPLETRLFYRVVKMQLESNGVLLLFSFECLLILFSRRILDACPATTSICLWVCRQAFYNSSVTSVYKFSQVPTMGVVLYRRSMKILALLSTSVYHNAFSMLLCSILNLTDLFLVLLLLPYMAILPFQDRLVRLVRTASKASRASLSWRYSGVTLEAIGACLNARFLR